MRETNSTTHAPAIETMSRSTWNAAKGLTYRPPNIERVQFRPSHIGVDGK